MKPGFKFFENRDCQFFPCHDMGDSNGMNCLFCFCPLYFLGNICGGNYSVLDGDIKDCSNCLIPHRPENYDMIMRKVGENIRQGKL